MSFRQKLLLAATVFILTLTSLFLFRDALLNTIISHEQKVIMDRYKLHLSVGKAGFQGIRDIYINQISLVPHQKDTLVYISRVEVKMSLSLLFRLRIGFNEVYADSVFVTAHKYKDGTDNYSMLIKGRKRDTVLVNVEPVLFNDRLSALLRKVNNIFNENVVMNAMRFSYSTDGQTEFISIPELFYDKENLKASMVTASADGVCSYTVKGTVDQRNSSYDFVVSRTGTENAAWPFLDLFDSFKLTFDELHVNLQYDADAGVIPVNATLHFKNMNINQWRISPVDVLFNSIEWKMKMLVDDHRISVEKGTTLRFSNLPISIEGFYEKRPAVRIAANLMFNCNANDFFNSLPTGMFNTLQGLKAGGTLNYSLNFDLDKSKPDEVVFESSLKKDHFRIIQYGTEYFPIINGDFQFTAMDKERPVRTIYVGTTNPMFAPYAAISDNLKNAVLTSEDPGFMTHAGFVESAFRESIATNIKEGRFARGGSTISMQLVKNLFLSRNKTISRKLEEAMIVWLIEQNRLVSKERMFEVYLNIIEWGPDVYGIGEASRFYFSKLPSELNLSESVFLASIIPHPKYFKYMFDSTGTLKENQKGFYELVVSRLVKRNIISPLDSTQTLPAVKLNGEALNLILPLDSISVDSLKLEELQKE